MIRSILVTLMLQTCLGTGCASPSNGSSDPRAADSLRSIYVVRRGWHTGIAIAAKDWPNRDWAVLAAFPDAELLEFGWGDERYYQAERNTFWLGTRAALWPTSSVVHVIALQEPVTRNAAADDVVHIRVPLDHVRTIALGIEAEFIGKEPQPTGTPLGSAPGPNRFYAAKRRFFFPRMCNWWIATRLRQADCRVQPWTVISASRVMREARDCAHKL